MKLKLLILFLLTFYLSGFSQSARFVSRQINDYHSKNIAFQPVKLFSLDHSDKNLAYQNAARDLKVLKLDKDKLSQLLAEKPEALQFSFPFEDLELVVEMVRVDIYAPEFTLETNKQKTATYHKGVFYRGIIKGDERSVVAFSFFEDDVIGVASALHIGNVTLGKAKNSGDFVVYNDQKLTGVSPFICNTDELIQSEQRKISYDPRTSKSATLTNNCVRIYYEICNQPFLQNGASVQNTLNWISAVHNNINTLYYNDGVKMSLKKVFIWETADPYTGDYNDNLYNFRINRQFFDGDLAHLVNYPSTTSVAFLNSLCGENRYAYSGVNMTYNSLPTYSWIIDAMTHEMGHSLGSPHTHDCAWNGNSTPIDGCGPVAGYPGLFCEEVAPLPENGGTIMSYCHLLSYVGKNFAKGFGEQPSALIRQTVDGKSCLSQDCNNMCTSASTSFSVADAASTSVGVSVSTALADGQWNYRVTTPTGDLIKDGTASGSNFTISGLSPGTFYIVEVGTACSGTFQQSQIVLTDDNWCGKIITDAGGPNANYFDGENWVKTFYPQEEGQKMKITIQEFDLQQSKDVLSIRNGPAADSPAFPGSAVLTGAFIRGPFQSTHSTGAITLVFKADATINRPGFKALLSCETLGVKEQSSSKAVSVIPNPVKSHFSLQSSDGILSVEVLDGSGRLMKTYSKISSDNRYDASSLKPGVYTVKIKTKRETVIQKLIKE